jgi:hypothetical protein
VFWLPVAFEHITENVKKDFSENKFDTHIKHSMCPDNILEKKYGLCKEDKKCTLNTINVGASRFSFLHKTRRNVFFPQKLVCEHRMSIECLDVHANIFFLIF